MVFSKIKKVAIILLILFILLFPFWCVRGLCAEDTSGSIVNNLNAGDGTFFTTDYEFYCLVYKLIPEHKYRLDLKSNVGSRNILKSQDYPSPGVNYDVFGTLNYGDSIEFVADSNYLYISSVSGYLTVLEDIVLTDVTNNYIVSVNSLVENVGIDSIWNIFDISINYIVVVVLVAFGIYIIFRIINKVSKGKEGL